MPFAHCPICGTHIHLNVGDPEAWYLQQHPDVPFMSTVAGPCLSCFSDLGVGDTVEIRRHVSDHPAWASPGSLGAITLISSCNHGSIYHVDVRGGKDDVFIRSEIHKVRK